LKENNMGKPHPLELRQRVVAHVEQGHTHRATAAHFRVSVKFVNDMVKLQKGTGRLEPKPQGRQQGHGKLEPYKDWLLAQVEQQGDITLDQLARATGRQRAPSRAKPPETTGCPLQSGPDPGYCRAAKIPGSPNCDQ
jgi:hypothetical protein